MKRVAILVIALLLIILAVPIFTAALPLHSHKHQPARLPRRRQTRRRKKQETGM